MFTKEQIESASSKVKSGSDYPALIQEFKKKVIIKCEHIVSDNSTI